MNMAAKPQKVLDITYGVDVVPNADGPGYLAFYRAPGLAPGTVRNPETRRVEIFPTEDAAKAAGAQRLFDVLNAPRERTIKHSGKSERYARLSGPELAILLKESGITLTLAVYLYGTTERRFLQWLDGRNEKGQEELAPHPVRVLLELFKANPTNIDIAEAVTDAVTSHYSEKRQD